MSNPSLSKTCVACGLQKPLSAFLQISGAQGTMYGNVCSTCRGSGLDKITIPVEEEESSSSSGLKIDSKTKVQLEREKRRLQEEKIERELKEQDKIESLTDEKLDRKEEKAQSEKKHRESFLDARKKDSFLGFQTAKKADPQQTVKTAQEKQFSAESQATIEEMAKVEGERKDQVVQADVQEKGVDLKNLSADQYVGGKLKFGAEFRKVKAWLGKDAPMSTVERQFGLGNKQVAEKKGKDGLIDLVKENWEPSNSSPGKKR